MHMRRSWVLSTIAFCCFVQGISVAAAGAIQTAKVATDSIGMFVAETPGEMQTPGEMPIATSTDERATSDRLLNRIGQLPLAFVEGCGAVHDPVEFRARGL